jgi:hypothetical protein
MYRSSFDWWVSLSTTYLFLQTTKSKKGRKNFKRRVPNKDREKKTEKPEPRASPKVSQNVSPKAKPIAQPTAQPTTQPSTQVTKTVPNPKVKDTKIRAKATVKKTKVQKRRVKKSTPAKLRKVPLKRLSFSKKPEPKQEVKPKKEPVEGEIPEELRWLQEDPHELLLSRFIETSKGTRLGESIGIDKKMLIMKKKSKFYSIPLKAIKEKGDVLILKKRVDWKKASKLGESWRRRTLDVIPGKQTKSSKVIKIE